MTCILKYILAFVRKMNQGREDGEEAFTIVRQGGEGDWIGVTDVEKDYVLRCTELEVVLDLCLEQWG